MWPDLAHCPGRSGNNIASFQESRLQGDAAGVEDVRIHPAEPFTIYGSFRVKF